MKNGYIIHSKYFTVSDLLLTVLRKVLHNQPAPYLEDVSNIPSIRWYILFEHLCLGNSGIKKNGVYGYPKANSGVKVKEGNSKGVGIYKKTFTRYRRNFRPAKNLTGHSVHSEKWRNRPKYSFFRWFQYFRTVTGVSCKQNKSVSKHMKILKANPKYANWFTDSWFDSDLCPPGSKHFP